MMGGFDGVLRAEVNGTGLAYREHGQGKPVVFVHGSASDMRTWEHQLHDIGASHRAIAYSRRYARPNEPIPEGVDDPMLPHVMEPAAKAYRRGDDEAGFEVFARGVLGSEAFERLSSERRAQAWDNVAVDKAQLLGEGLPPLSDDEVRGVAVPTLLLHGERSPGLFRLLAERLDELLPNARREEVPGASHIMHEDNPAVVNEAIAGFLMAGRSQAS